MCNDCVVGKKNITPLKGLMEAACIIEMIVQYIHCNSEEDGHLPTSLLVTCFNPMAHVTETGDDKRENMWSFDTCSKEGDGEMQVPITAILPHAFSFNNIYRIRVVSDAHRKNCS